MNYPLLSTLVQTGTVGLNSFGMTLATSSVQDVLTAFFGVAGVVAIPVTVVGLRFVPKIWRAVKSLVGR